MRRFRRADIVLVPGVLVWRFPASENPLPVLTLLHREPDLTLTGLCLWWPRGLGDGRNLPGDGLVLVHPGFRRRGIGAVLLACATVAWGADVREQRFSASGRATVEAFLARAGTRQVVPGSSVRPEGSSTASCDDRGC